MTAYSMSDYQNDIVAIGLQETWRKIFHIIKCGTNYDTNLFTPDNFGELYEIGLETLDKQSKKEHGKYYTPMDVAEVMSKWLIPLQGTNVCDVCCGTGNLILSYLKMLGRRKARNLIKKGRLFLYDMDNIAMYICKETIGLLYGYDIYSEIHCVSGDFLDSNIVLPENAKVISNPPYFKITEISDRWGSSNVVLDSKEFYSSIMEKILISSSASVIITPYSFIGGQKFQSLRKIMNEHSGYIVSFDNVPGCIFNGRKHGIFNTNTSNSVRAAITVTENTRALGYRVSPLIRFKTEERESVLNADRLKECLPKRKQHYLDGEAFYKCDKDLERLLVTWLKSKNNLSSLVSTDGAFKLTVPNSCRYYTVAAIKDLNRTGKYELFFEKEETMKLAYGLINSSFCYWYWRLYDGGITYPKSLLSQMPIIFNKMKKEQKDKFLAVVDNMIANENIYLSYKKNANEMQESVKFPIIYRKELSNIIMDVLGVRVEIEKIHSNCYTNEE